MNIEQLIKSKMNPALAYIIGLIYPLYSEKELNGKKYLLGCINHNVGHVTQGELNEHYIEICRLFEKYELNELIKIRANKMENNITISKKAGFSIIIEIEEYYEYKNKLDEIIKEVKNNKYDKEIQCYFIRGCFDGRSSYDRQSHYLAVDVNSDTVKQEAIKKIIENFGIEININIRKKGSNKNDQIRIKKEFLKLYLSKIGMYSACRRKLIENYINGR